MSVLYCLAALAVAVAWAATLAWRHGQRRPDSSWLPRLPALVRQLSGERRASPEVVSYKVRYEDQEGRRRSAWVLVPHADSDCPYLSWVPIRRRKRAKP